MAYDSCDILSLLHQLCILIPCAPACVLPFSVYLWHLWSSGILTPFSGLILKAQGRVSKEGICLLLLLVIPYSSFFSLQDGWCVLIKMSIVVLVTVKDAQERSFKCVAGKQGMAERIW